MNALAQVDRGGVEVGLGRRGPEVELVSRRTALETLIRIPPQMDGELAASLAARPVNVTARPYPGIPTDVQAQWMALLSLSDGRSTVRDRVFPGRWMHVAKLNRLGARIEVHDGKTVIHGVDRLRGAEVTATDLRASAALVLVGLAAQSETVVRDADHLDRGYERLDQKLIQLGANVERVPSRAVETVAPVG